MRLAILILLSGASPVFAQTTPAWKAFQERQAEFRKRGGEALQHERERRKADLCSKVSNGNVGISGCLSTELKTTEASYLTYVRSIGALLRLAAPDQPPSEAEVPFKRLPFDAAEAAWQSYREQGCVAMSTQWQGSQAGVAYQNCRLDITWNHMDELANLYADLWH